MMVAGKKVGVLLGGMSSEREVSLSTGRAVVKALSDKGYDVVMIDAQKDLARQLTDTGVEVVYNALHGKFGEDGCVQGLLEVLGIPYTGSSVTASAVAMDKVISNVLLKRAGLTVPAWQVFHRDIRTNGLPDLDFPLPVVVKPVTEGSSVGISIVREPLALASALETAFEYDARAMVQQFVDGREITVAVLEGKALGTVEVRPKLEFYNYLAKYTKGMTEYLCPAPVSVKMEEELFRLAERGNAALACEGGTRVDFIVDEKDVPYVLEINTLPGLTETSLVPKVAAGAGIPFEDLVERILQGARLKMGN